MLQSEVLLWTALMFLNFESPAVEERPAIPFVNSVAHCFAVSSDSKRLAVGCWDVWDIPSRKRLFGGKTRAAWGMNFSPDGKFLAVTGNFSEFFVYDAATGREYWNLTLTGHGDTVVEHVEFTHDSKFLVSASGNGMMRVWDVQKKKPVAIFCFPTPVKYAQHAQDEYLRAWRALAGNTPPDNVKMFIVHKKQIEHFGRFSLSPDGKTVAIPTRTAEVLLIELLTGKIVKTLTTKQESTCSVRYSLDGKLLAVGGGGGDGHFDWKGTIELWDVVKAKRIRECKGHCHTVLNMSFSPDTKLLASGGTVDGVRVWDVATGKEKYALHQKKLDKENPITSGSRSLGVAFLPDGKALLTMTDEVGAPIHFWEPATGKRIPQPPPAKEKDGK